MNALDVVTGLGALRDEGMVRSELSLNQRKGGATGKQNIVIKRVRRRLLVLCRHLPLLVTEMGQHTLRTRHSQ